jgi:hypothetical protein
MKEKCKKERKRWKGIMKGRKRQWEMKIIKGWGTEGWK